MKLAYKLSSASALAGVLALAALAGTAQAQAFKTTNIISDGFVPAQVTDPLLVNPWGISSGPGGPFWVSDNGTGYTTVYNGAGGTVLPPIQISPGAGVANPTGQVFNSTSDFTVTNGTTSGKAAFLFASENGIITGWSPAVNFGESVTAIDNSGAGAIYKGITIGVNGGVSTLYATNFGDNMVDTWNGSFTPTGSLAADPGIPSNYAPFNVQVLDGHIFVTYAEHVSGIDEVDGAGLGYVDEYNLDGTFDRRIASAGGPLNAPWGLAIAPASWGAKFGGDLLVGNFGGDGNVNAYDLTTGHYDGMLLGPGGSPLKIDGLWGLIPGEGGTNGSPNNIYFAAGTDNENHGLFGSISLGVPEPGAWTVMILGLGLLGAAMRRTRTRLSPA